MPWSSKAWIERRDPGDRDPLNVKPAGALLPARSRQPVGMLTRSWVRRIKLVCDVVHASGAA
jgi:hypothetical protein